MPRPKIRVTAVTEVCVTLNHVDVPRELWTILEKFSEQQRVSTLQGFWMLLLKVMNELKRGKRSVFPDVAAASNFATEEPASPPEDKPVEPVVNLPSIDAYVDLLETNAKAASGYVGVYPNGKAFRASGPRPGGRGGRYAVNIGTYETPDQAALARLLYHRRHKIPYGRHAAEVQKQLEWLHETGRSEVTFDDALDFLNESRVLRGQSRIEITNDGLLYVGDPPPPMPSADDDGDAS